MAGIPLPSKKAEKARVAVLLKPIRKIRGAEMGLQ
jgi:hypothetical protein